MEKRSKGVEEKKEREEKDEKGRKKIKGGKEKGRKTQSEWGFSSTCRVLCVFGVNQAPEGGKGIMIDLH